MWISMIHVDLSDYCNDNVAEEKSVHILRRYFIDNKDVKNPYVESDINVNIFPNNNVPGERLWNYLDTFLIHPIIRLNEDENRTLNGTLIFTISKFPIYFFQRHFFILIPLITRSLKSINKINNLFMAHYLITDTIAFSKVFTDPAQSSIYYSLILNVDVSVSGLL